jgi:hypothetical protein
VLRETKEQRTKRKLDLELDKELEDTFPASDALKITRGRKTIRRQPRRPAASEQKPN